MNKLLSYSNKTDFLMDETKCDEYLGKIIRKSNLVSDQLRAYFTEVREMLDSLKSEVETHDVETDNLFFNIEEVTDLIDYTKDEVKKRINYILYQIQDSASIVVDLLNIGNYEGFRNNREVVKRNEKVTQLVSKTKLKK